MTELDLPTHSPMDETTLQIPDAGTGIARLGRRYPVREGPDGEALYDTVELEAQIVPLEDPPHTLPPTTITQRQRVVTTDAGAFVAVWTDRARSDDRREIKDLHVYRLGANERH